MRSLILISKNPMVIKIFNLVSNKLMIKLEVLSEVQIDHKVDVIVVDKEMIDDRFNILKSYSKVVGVISNEELPFDTANDFLIPSPFLPSMLEPILNEQLEVVNRREKTKVYVSTIEEEEDTASDMAVDYLDQLADGIALGIDNIEPKQNEEDTISHYIDDDDSIVFANNIANDDGGVLDSNELSKLEGLIDIQNKPPQKEYTIDEDTKEWNDLSSIIDDAINEVNSTTNLLNSLDEKPIAITLSDYSLTELTPLFNIVDQDVINSLTAGKSVMIELKLGETENG